MILLATLIQLSNSWSRDFWAPEEPDFAAVIREMEIRMARGESWAWLFPTIGGEPYSEKPPLIYWLGLLSSRLTGADARLAYRIPIALAAAFSLLVTYMAGRRFFNSKVALAAVWIQATSYLHFHCGSWLLTDMLFSAAVALSVVAFGVSILWRAGSLRWSLLGWLGLSMAALSKSAPLAFILVFGPILLFVITKPGGPGIRREVLALKPFHGLALFLALVAPWYLAVYFVKGSEFFREHFVDQHLLRLIGAESHARPFWQYFQTLAVDFLPWSPFLPLLVFYGKAHFRRPSPRFFAVWALFTFVVLSAISSKQGKYLLPIWPALALLAAAALLEEEQESIWEGFLGEGVLRGLAWGLMVPLAVAALGALSWGIGLHKLLNPGGEVGEILGDEKSMLLWSFLALLACGALFAAGLRIHRGLGAGGPAAPVAHIGAAALIAFILFSFAYGSLNRFKSARALCERVKAVTEGKKLALYGRNRAAVHYYLERSFIHISHLDRLQTGSEEERKLDDFLASEEEVFLLTGVDDLKKLQADFPKYRDRFRSAEERLRFGYHREAVLVSSRQSSRIR